MSNTEVLLIDDSRADQRFITRALDMAGKNFHIDAAASMAEAQAKLCRKKYDCLLVDYNLPDANGLDLVQDYCNGRRSGFVGLVMITGEGDERLAARAIKLGAHEYLAKDQLDGSRLIRAVENAVEKAAMQRNLSHQQLIMEHFASSAAHDLANPLNGIKGYIELARRYLHYDRPAEVPELLDNALSAADYMQRLLADLLHYARTGTASDSLALVNLSDTVGLAARVLEKTLEDAGATLEIGPLPTIEGYATELVQLFQNLIANAVKYRSDLPPYISIHAHELPDHWLVAVEDNGVGVPEEEAEKIFAPLHRLHRKDTDGFGLGLAICAKITDLHGGRIWCDRNFGRGSTFKVMLSKSLSHTDRAQADQKNGVPQYI